MAQGDGPRIVVIGSSGAGKTTLARRIAVRLGIAQIELDALNWGPGWRNLSVEAPEVFLGRVKDASAARAWVSDGNYGSARPILFDRATDVIWLDYSRAVVMRRVIWRSIRGALERGELWPGTGNRETVWRWLDPEHPIRWAWSTHARRRASFAALFEAFGSGPMRLHRLRTPSEADGLLERIAAR